MTSKPLYLITGASGFVGGALTEHLANKDVKLRALVRRPETAGDLERLGVEVFVGDLGDREVLTRALDGVYGVYHIAALFREAKLPATEYFRVNAQCVRILFEECERSGVQRVIHCSTTGVLGSIKHPPADESAPYSPCDVYQESKVEGEKIALSFFAAGRLGGVVLRPAMIWGPGDTRIFKLFKMIAARRFMYIGSGVTWCHFIDVRELARAFELAMQHTERSGEVYTIAGSQPVRLREVVQMISSALGVPPPRFRIPALPVQMVGLLCELACRPFGIEPPIYRRRVDFFVKHRSFITSKAEQHLGFHSKRSVEEEVQEIVSWYLAQGWIKQQGASPSGSQGVKTAPSGLTITHK